MNPPAGKYADYTVKAHDGMGSLTNDREAAIEGARWAAECLADRSEDGWVKVSDRTGTVVKIDVQKGMITEEWK